MRRIAFLIAVSAMSFGCVSTQQVTDSPLDPDKWESEARTDDVSSMRLSQTWGEVGKPFASTLNTVDNIRKEREYSVSKLPPGLKFDSKSGKILGVPKQSGFYIVSVAMRSKVEDRLFRYTTPNDRWFSEEFELRIYNQIVEGE